MKKFFKILLRVIMIIVIILLSITIFVISMNSEKIPTLSVNASQSQATMITGNYDWNAFTQVLKQEDYNYKFKSENTIIVSPGEVVTISMPEQVGSKRLFETKNVYYLDNIGNQYMTSSVPQENPIDSYANRYTEQLVMPDKEDTYYYYMTINYHEKGEVEYAFKVVVTTEAKYDITELAQYKNLSLTEYERIQELIGILPYSKNIDSIAIRSTSFPTRLMIHYTEFIVDRDQYYNNVIALFTLIPALDIIEYSSPDGFYYFSRDEIELILGRDLEDYAISGELWEKEVLYKEKDDNNADIENAITNTIVESLQIYSGDKINLMLIDDSTFNILFDKTDSKMSIRNLYKDLMQYAKNVINIDYYTYKDKKYTDPFIMLSSVSYYEPLSGDSIIESGDNEITKNDLHNIEMLVIKDKKEIVKKFELYTQDGEWIISEVD